MILWMIATIVAFFVKGLCGFANTLVFTSILGFGVNNVNISPVELVLGYPTNLILTWKGRKHLQKNIYIPLSILVLIGSIPGALFLKMVDAQKIKVIFGVTVVLVGCEMFLREYQKIQLKQSRILLGIIGILAGILSGLFGVGALLAAYVGRATENSREFKANISAVFIVENTVRIVLYTALGIITAPTLKQSVLLMPCMLIGLFLGIKSGQILNENIVKKLVIVLLILSGLVLIGKNI